jgi:hypothetical protein
MRASNRTTICALKGQFKNARGSAPGTRDRREIFALKGQVKPTRNKHLDSCITIGARWRASENKTHANIFQNRSWGHATGAAHKPVLKSKQVARVRK